MEECDISEFILQQKRLFSSSSLQVNVENIVFDCKSSVVLEGVLQNDVIHLKSPVLLYLKSETVSTSSSKLGTTESVSDWNENEISLNNTSTGVDVSVGGSPLKLQEFHMDCSLVQDLSFDACNNVKDKKITVKGKPFDVSIARYLLSLHNQSINKGSKFSLWVYCDAADQEGTFLLGSFCDKYYDAHAVDECGDGNDSQESCIIKNYSVSCQGPFFHKDQFPKILELKKKHFIDNLKVESGCYAHIDILGLSGQELATQNLSSLKIDLEWEKSTSLLQKPPMDSKATVIVGIVEGDMRSAAYPMYSELHTLQGFVNSLKEGIVEWAVQNEDESVLSRLEKLLEALKQGDCGKKPVKNEEEISSPIKSFVLIYRKDLDFTEHVWNILKDCTCYKDLVTGLQLVLTYLQKGFIQPMVHKRNLSKLAQLVRESYYDKMAETSMEGLLPLIILIEIGTEKLQRDYTNAFIGKDLATASHIECFLKPDASVEEKLSGLLKLHSALEVAVMLEQNLNLPKHVLSKSSRQALKYYESNAVTNGHLFTIPVQTSTIASVIERFPASVWKVKFRGSTEFHSSCCISYTLTTNPVVNYYKVLNKIDDSKIDKDAMGYYLTTESENAFIF